MTINAEKAGEKILVLGVGQLGAAILDALLPAAASHGHIVTAGVSPGSLDENGQLLSQKYKKYAAAGGDSGRR